jgi:hypothetical protein
MVVPVIDKNRIFTVEAKGETPVAIYFHRPMSSQLSMQRMQIPPIGAHVHGRPRSVQRRELEIQLACVTGLNSGFAPGKEELLDPGVSKTPDHVSRVTLHDTRCP